MSKLEILEVAVIVIVVGLIILASVKAPCGLYKFAANKDVPARCIGEYR
jgi:hypothetical protein